VSGQASSWIGLFDMSRTREVLRGLGHQVADGLAKGADDVGRQRPGPGSAAAWAAVHHCRPFQGSRAAAERPDRARQRLGAARCKDLFPFGSGFMGHVMSLQHVDAIAART
jgi:hypothetical protein